jgi:transposase
MHHYRQALLRMRQGDSDRDIADAKIMGRRKVAQWRALAQSHGWLDAQAPLPDDEAVAAALQPPKRASTTVSSLEEPRAKVASWVEQGVPGTAIHQALQRQHDWRGSYSAVRRMVFAIRATLPREVTCRLDFAPGEAAQVDFGAGPILLHPDGKPRRTWAFVMTLAHSRHQYLEFVRDQTVATWLGCHRRAFEWFAGVPERIVIEGLRPRPGRAARLRRVCRGLRLQDRPVPAARSAEEGHR